VPISDRARAAVAAGRGSCARDSLWLSRPERSISAASGLYQLLQELAADAGHSSGPDQPHVLRHAFATHLLEGGADLARAADAARPCGHRTTQIYTHVDSRRLIDLVNSSATRSLTQACGGLTGAIHADLPRLRKRLPNWTRA
jgi:integrase/recombinase XerD